MQNRKMDQYRKIKLEFTILENILFLFNFENIIELHKEGLGNFSTENELKGSLFIKNRG